MEALNREAPVDLTGRFPRWSAATSALIQRNLVTADQDSASHRAPPAEGDPDLRRVLADLLGAPAEGLRITTGVRDAAHCLGGVFRAHPFRVEAPGFTGIADALQQAGAHVTIQSWDRLFTPREPATTDAAPVRWITPFARNPDGARLRADQRVAVELLATERQPVVCNEVYRWYSYDAFVLDRSIRVGSLSKLAGPGVRLGWIAAPPWCADEIAAKLVARPPALWQRAWGRLIGDHGTEPFDSAVQGALNAKAAFAGTTNTVVQHIDGPCLLWNVDGQESAAVRRAASAGVLVNPGGEFHADRPSVRLTFTGVSEEAARTAGERLKPLLDDGTLTPPILDPGAERVLR